MKTAVEVRDCGGRHLSEQIIDSVLCSDLVVIYICYQLIIKWTTAAQGFKIKPRPTAGLGRTRSLAASADKTAPDEFMACLHSRIISSHCLVKLTDASFNRNLKYQNFAARSQSTNPIRIRTYSSFKIKAAMAEGG